MESRKYYSKWKMNKTARAPSDKFDGDYDGNKHKVDIDFKMIGCGRFCQ
jgi:hypothetical protein